MINDINVQQVQKNRHPRQTFTQCVRVIPSCNITFKQFLVGGFPTFEGRPWKSHVGNALTPLSLAKPLRIRNYPGYLINLNKKGYIYIVWGSTERKKEISGIKFL